VAVWRTWIFPIIRILIFAAIAVALVKVAFFADTEERADVDSPSAEIVEPQYEVAIGTIKNDVEMTGTVLPKPAVPIAATLTGEVTGVSVKQGATVEKGDAILTLTAETVNDKGDVEKKVVVVLAPASGTLSSFSALVGQSFATGDPVGQIAPPTFIVTGSLAPDQLYRLVDQPKSAKVTITNGPAPFDCKRLRITSPLAGAEAETGGEAATGGPTITCAVPSSVTVFAGLGAKLTIPGGSAKDVLIVPTTAVEGIAQTGNVYALLPDGTTEKRPVKIGLSDGHNVEITEGLAAGDLILQFIPGAPAIPEGCYVDEFGATVCDE
jgi:multidrug efflux pump subunit AcrA (membrane-fusion protein)